jgi:hypothetical protein
MSSPHLNPLLMPDDFELLDEATDKALKELGDDSADQRRKVAQAIISAHGSGVRSLDALVTAAVRECGGR